MTDGKKKTAARGKGLSEVRLEEMIEEAIMNAYDESEQTSGFWTMLAIAHKTATPDQGKALAEVADRQSGGQRRGTKP
jgi:hypothetical protein